MRHGGFEGEHLCIDRRPSSEHERICSHTRPAHLHMIRYMMTFAPMNSVSTFELHENRFCHLGRLFVVIQAPHVWFIFCLRFKIFMLTPQKRHEVKIHTRPADASQHKHTVASEHDPL